MVMAGWAGPGWKDEDRHGPDAIGEIPRADVDELPAERLLRRDQHATGRVDGLVDQRFQGSQPAAVPNNTKLAGDAFGKLGCGAFHPFWWKR